VVLELDTDLACLELQRSKLKKKSTLVDICRAFLLFDDLLTFERLLNRLEKHRKSRSNCIQSPGEINYIVAFQKFDTASIPIRNSRLWFNLIACTTLSRS